MNIINWIFRSIFLFLIIFQTKSAIQLYHLQITQTNQTFTQTFLNVFQNYPYFAYFIEGATIQNTEFSVNYDQSRTSLTNSQIVINFYTYKASSFSASEYINIGLLVTDQISNQFSIGVKIRDLSSTLSLTFPNLTLVKSSSSYGKLQIYSLCFPFLYNQALNMTSSNTIVLTITKSSTNYQRNVNIGYIYYNSNYVGDRVIAVFQQINQAFYSYFVPYQPFAFSPSTNNIMFALRQYDSLTTPFINTLLVQDYNYITGISPQMMLGFSFPSGIPTKFNSDIIFFNNSYSGCSDNHFLYYINLYQTLPYSCIPCNPKCLKCGTSSSLNSALTDSNSCTECVWMRYLNASTQGNGNCVCWPGIEQVNGVCQECSQGCLQFDVSFIQTTNTSNFLLQYSYGTVNQLLPLKDNLQVYINSIQVPFYPNQQEGSYYIISISSSDMKVCQGITCYIKFSYQYPQYVLIDSQNRSLSNNNITVSLDNYIDYYSYFPQSLQQGFNILGIAIGMAFSGGFSSLVTILFEVQQLIDAHRYINLQLPVVFNQFLLNMVYFRFLSILNVMPYSYTQKIQSSVPNDLDCRGPTKLLYYENGLNFYKNIIPAFISVAALLIINFIIYLILKLIPLKITRKLAKKIEIRKFITVHDTIQQLQLPCMYLALQQLQVVLLHPNLVWIYAMAITTTIFIILFPFFVVFFIYLNRQKKTKIQIYEDLLQDNLMSQKVTYIYYIFNYYRKIFFALCILSIIPGLVQIYLLIILNFLHLSFQVYLVISRTYKSKMKVVIRFTQGLCIIAIEIMILLYNLNDYQKQKMINIGMACLYLTLFSTMMGILDVFVKIGDTCLQQLRSKHEQEQKMAIRKLKILKEFKNEIKCNIGDELQDRPKDPKQIKFLEDKQLMENTFNKDNQSQQKMSVQLSEKGKTNGDGMDLVFIDDDWMQTYPYEIINFKPIFNKQTGQLIKQEVKQQQAEVDLYEIPQRIEKQAKRVKQNRIKSKKNKYQIDIDQQEIKKQRDYRHLKSKQTKEKTKSDSLVVTIIKKDTSESRSQSSVIQETISQQ